MYVSIKRDGLTLRGKLEKKKDGNVPIAIMFHGFCGDIDDKKGSGYQTICDLLNDKGIATIRFDFNGHGRSDGDFSNMNMFNEINDAIAILEYVRKLDFVTDIYVVGHSQGGVVGGMLAGYYPDVVKKLVMISPAATLKSDAQKGKCMDGRYDTNHIPDVVDVDGGSHLVGGHFFRIAKSLPIYEVTTNFTNKALVIHGRYDNIVSCEASKKYKETMPDCDLRIYDKIDHGFSGEDQHKVYDSIVEFLTC